MRLCSYVVVHDSGYAPNPFWGYCTLTACTPNRQGLRLDPGDWLAGHSTVHQGQKLVHAMRVSEVLDFDDYYRDARFARKHPRFDRTWREATGDNVYHRGADGRWIQDRNPFHGSAVLQKDTRNPRVYVSDRFFYFGENAVPIPAEFTALIRDRQGCRCDYPAALAARFVGWLEENWSPGVHGQPRDRLREIPGGLRARTSRSAGQESCGCAQREATERPVPPDPASRAGRGPTSCAHDCPPGV